MRERCHFFLGIVKNMLVISFIFILFHMLGFSLLLFSDQRKLPCNFSSFFLKLKCYHWCVKLVLINLIQPNQSNIGIFTVIRARQQMRHDVCAKNKRFVYKLLILLPFFLCFSFFLPNILLLFFFRHLSFLLLFWLLLTNSTCLQHHLHTSCLNYRNRLKYAYFTIETLNINLYLIAKEINQTFRFHSIFLFDFLFHLHFYYIYIYYWQEC